MTWVFDAYDLHQGQMMAENEIEVKFYINNPALLKRRLDELGAKIKHPRVHEVNLRFDTPDGALSQEHRVLRLRRDKHNRLTYKGPALDNKDVSIRQEIEFEVDDFEAARQLLEALGYEVSIVYEKYRTTYEFYDTEIVLDEMPYGDFVEIEGPDIPNIQDVAAKLRLDWKLRCIESYMTLFKRLQINRDLSIQNLTFEELQGITVHPIDLGVSAAG